MQKKSYLASYLELCVNIIKYKWLTVVYYCEYLYRFKAN
jgi:hypothetical protein